MAFDNKSKAEEYIPTYFLKELQTSDILIVRAKNYSDKSFRKICILALYDRSTISIKGMETRHSKLSTFPDKSFSPV
ncbi:MAG: hypothetical protein K0R90_679 [Oscillospiraceae bacterium]|jgi:hypothetical protein|nr:hypothetical protein [Oscillospiraceae bacterium]